MTKNYLVRMIVYKEYISNILNDISKVCPPTYEDVGILYSSIMDSIFEHDGKKIDYLVNQFPKEFPKYSNLINNKLLTHDKMFFIWVIMKFHRQLKILKYLSEKQIHVIYVYGMQCGKIENEKELSLKDRKKANDFQLVINDLRHYSLAFCQQKSIGIFPPEFMATIKNIVTEFISYVIGSYPDYFTNKYAEYANAKQYGDLAIYR